MNINHIMLSNTLTYSDLLLLLLIVIIKLGMLTTYTNIHPIIMQ